MNFYVDSLRDLPVNRVDYFVHVIGLTDSSHLRRVNENLDSLNRLFGPDVGLVSGPAALSEEVFQFLSRTLWPHLPSLKDLLSCTTCLLISEGHLAQTRKKTYLIPVSTLDDSESSHELMTTLMSMVASALRAHTLDFLVGALGAQELRLACADSGFFVCALRHPEKLYELMPALAGQGASLNARIARCMAR